MILFYIFSRIIEDFEWIALSVCMWLFYHPCRIMNSFPLSYGYVFQNRVPSHSDVYETSHCCGKRAAYAKTVLRPEYFILK